MLNTLSPLSNLKQSPTQHLKAFSPQAQRQGYSTEWLRGVDALIRPFEPPVEDLTKVKWTKNLSS